MEASSPCCSEVQKLGAEEKRRMFPRMWRAEKSDPNQRRETVDNSGAASRLTADPGRTS
jgi:hypothetical protein